MCPFCLATAAWIAAATVSTTGAAALVATKVLKRNAATVHFQKSVSKEEHDGQHND